MAKSRKSWRAALAGSMGCVLVGGYWLSAQEISSGKPLSVLPPAVNGPFVTVAQPGTQPAQPPGTQPAVPPTATQPPSPAQPPAPAPPPPTNTTPNNPSGLSSFLRFAAPSGGDSGSSAAPSGAGAQGVVSTAQAQTVASSPAASVVSGGEATTRSTSDTGDLLGKSLASVGVFVQRRNPIVSDAHVRGFKWGQIVTHADGAFWTYARMDLDTIVSKIDSSNLTNIAIIKGPYSVRHGAGFSFIDIETLGSARFENFEVHGSTGFAYKENGGQFKAQQSIWGGGRDHGFRISWDSMSGSDYQTGSDLTMPASYNSQNFSFAYGFDLSDCARLELRALHLSQRDIEFPGVITDLNKGITDGYALRFIWEDQPLFDRLTFDAWYNETRFDGDSLRPSKNQNIPDLEDILRYQRNQDQNNIINKLPPIRFTVETNGETSTWGVREAMTWGKEKEPQVTLGVDFNYISTAISEFDRIGPSLNNFPIPRSYSTDPGFFLDGMLPVGDCFTVKSGVRFDFQQSSIRQPLSFPFQEVPGFTREQKLQLDLGPNSLTTQNFDTWASFITGEYKFTDQVSGQIGYGYAQRPPTLTELYSAGTFLSLFQPGLTFFYGNSDLRQEQMHQIDLGLRGNFEFVRAGVTGFYSHVFDYVTFLPVNNLGVFKGYQFVNTGQAVLAGTEAFAEADLYDWLTPFATLAYVGGRDITRSEPLPGIFPLESRLGFRIHEATRSPKWAVEFTARIVAPQNRVAVALGDPSTAFTADGRPTNEVATPGFVIYDIRGYYALSKNVLLTAGIENLGDRFYREHLDLRDGVGMYQPGINGYMGLRMTY